MKAVYLCSVVLLLFPAEGLPADVEHLSDQYDKQQRGPSVAIVGAGVGGAFTASHLQDLLHESMDLQM